MSQLLLAGNLIPYTTAGIPGQGWGHLQVVYLANDGSAIEIEVQAPLGITVTVY